MSNFLLNLANRSMGQSNSPQGITSLGSAGSPAQGQPSMPQARPYLTPLFMPPAVLVAPTYVPPMPPAPADFAPPSFPPQMPARLDARLDAQLGESGIDEASIASARATMPAPLVDASDDFVRALRPALPPIHPEARPTPVPQLPPLPSPPAQTAIPSMPTRSVVPTPPEGEIQIERIVEARQSVVLVQPAPPSLPMPSGVSEQASEATRPSAPQPEPAPREITLPRFLPSPAEPPNTRSREVSEPGQTPTRQSAMPVPLTPSDDNAPRRVMPAPLQPPTVNAEPSPTVSPRQESTPAVPQMIQQPSAPSLAHERVQPAATHVRQPPAIRHEPAAPTIDVQIGVIDLHLAPPAPALPAPYASPRRAHGFDAFRRLRSSGGWEA